MEFWFEMADKTIHKFKDYFRAKKFYEHNDLDVVRTNFVYQYD